MIFAIYRIDRVQAAGGRDAHRAAHLAYLKGFESAILCAGALWSSDDAACDVGAPSSQPREIGSLYLVEFDSQAQAEAFASNDPFNVAGMFERVEVRHFQARMGTKKDVFAG